MAVSDAKESVSYTELWCRTEAMARLLRASGCRPGRPIGLCMSPTVSRVASILGAIGIGSPYVPIDPNLPDGRIRVMMDSAGAGHVIVDERTAARFSAMSYELVDASTYSSSDSMDSTLIEPSGSDLAYIIYTSGSTGTPKGVAVEHGSLSHLLKALDGVLPPRRDDSAQCWLAAANICFDMSVADLFWPLSRGIPIVVAELESLAGRSDEGAEFLTSVLTSGRITHFQATPSLVQLMLQDPVLAGAVRSLEVLVMGGEIVQPGLVAQLGPVPYLYNGYGPTEATVYTTMHRCTGEDVEHVPIGRPLPGVDVRVVDEAGRDRPPGLLGELLIAGPGLARGYINDAELTARKFPVLGGRRWYRTGDLASVDADSTVRYQGRIDSQVKVRGFRVELGEIEAAIHAVPGVDEAAVFPVRGPGGRVTGLTAAAKSAAADITEAAVFVEISKVLPKYAIPQAVKILPELPIGLTGKLDRKALERQLMELDPVSHGEAVDGRSFGDCERIVAEAWSSVLGADMTGEADRTFFDAGGNSILLGSVFARLRDEFPEADLHLVDMYRHPTISAMAARLSAGGAPSDSSGSEAYAGPGENRRALSAAERRRLARRAR
ncbi:non-ribosomal peptide synthetase [Amycolatopsis vastitatis]|uniref:non-ribosomal peptide synthetase n=1 Tax=Amycolatopsis vastitatis TaxID=1905142 RepID=UPI001F0A45FD|nr:non-ribosomal peptide synthetase [Amycolatopsis vastitatis]